MVGGALFGVARLTLFHNITENSWVRKHTARLEYAYSKLNTPFDI